MAEEIEEIEGIEPVEAAPEEATLINQNSQIPNDKKEEIAKEIIDQYLIDLDSRSDWEEKRDTWYKLWACERKKKKDPWPGASNVCIPMLASACQQFHARSYQSIFSAPGMVKTIPVGENDYTRAQNVEKYMNWQTMYEMEEYEDVFDRLLQVLPINGTAFKKCYYDKALDRPVSEHIRAVDMVLPYRTKSFETARRKAHRMWLHYDELLDRLEDGLYEADDFERVAIEPGVHAQSESAIRQSADEIAGEESDKPSERPHLILECHKKVDIGDGRQKYIFTVDVDSETLLRTVEGTIDSKELEYFTDYHFIPNPEGFYSFGFGHFITNLNEMANTAFNQIFDSGRLTNQPFGFYGRRAGFEKRKIKLQPGVMTEVEDATQIYFPSMQRVDQVLFMTLGLIQQYTEQFTSTSDYLSGRESKGTKTPTAHGTLAIIEQGLVSFAVLTKRVFRSLRKELRLLMALNQLFLPEEKQFRLMGDAEKNPFPKIKRKDFDTVYDITLIGDPSYASKLTRRQDAVEIYEILMRNPLVTGNPETGEGGNPEAIYELTSGVVDAYEMKNRNKILPEPPEKPIPPDAENAMFMQGDYEEPKPEENHKEHMAIHAQFAKGPYFNGMSDEYKGLVVKHVQETQRLMMMMEQAQKQLGGNPLGPPPQGGIDNGKGLLTGGDQGMGT